jgi:hypothetical protein
MVATMVLMLVVALLFASVVVLGLAVVYSRVVFDRYLKQRHADLYQRLRLGGPGDWLATDANYELARFRSQLADDLGDSHLRRMKLTSRRLYRLAIALWLGGVASFVALKWSDRG